VNLAWSGRSSFGRWWAVIAVCSYVLLFTGLAISILSGNWLFWLGSTALYLVVFLASVFALAKREQSRFGPTLWSVMETRSFRSYLRRFG
jgi:hypothetical protein